MAPHNGAERASPGQETQLPGAELTEHTKTQEPLQIGQSVLVQNQTGNKPLRWDKTGVIVDWMEHSQYSVKIDGSGALTLRNRKFLRPHSPFHTGEATKLPAQMKPPALEIPAVASAREPEDAQAAVRASTRTRKAPVWQQDYQCSSLDTRLSAHPGGQHSGGSNSSLSRQRKAFTFPDARGPGRDQMTRTTIDCH